MISWRRRHSSFSHGVGVLFAIHALREGNYYLHVFHMRINKLAIAQITRGTLREKAAGSLFSRRTTKIHQISRESAPMLRLESTREELNNNITPSKKDVCR